MLLIVGIAVLALVPLLFAKLLLSTPEGFEPRIHVSVFDRLQAVSFRRTAMKYASRGDYENARVRWRQASGNHPGDLGLLRAYLRTLLKLSPTPSGLAEGKQLSAWLLSVSNEAPQDRQLMLQFLEHSGDYYEILRVLAGQKDLFDQEELAFFLRALFHTGQFRSFQEVWEKRGLNTEDDPLFVFFRLANSVCLDAKRADLGAFRSSLDTLIAESGYKVVGLKAAIRVFAESHTLVDGLEILSELEKIGQLTLRDVLPVWRTAVYLGQPEIVQAQFTSDQKPVTEQELLACSRLLRLAGMNSKGVGLLESGLEVATLFSSTLVLELGNVLSAAHDWHALNQLVARVEPVGGPVQGLQPVFRYWRGLIAEAQGKDERVKEVYRAFSEVDALSMETVIPIASRLHLQGREEEALELFARVGYSVDADALRHLSLISQAKRDGDVTGWIAAADAAHEADPDNAIFLHSLAEALLCGGEQPNRALGLAGTAFVLNPKIIQFRFGLIWALMRNERWAEADALLRPVGVDDLNEPYILSRFKVLLLEKALAANRSHETKRIAETIAASEFEKPYQSDVERVLERALSL